MLSLLVCASLLFAAVPTANFFRCAEFYLAAERGGELPDLDAGFVPGGYCTVPDGLLVSGYMRDSGQARVYLIREGGEVNYTELLDDNLAPFISRASDIEFFDGYMYLTGPEGLYMYYYEDVRDGLAETDYYGIIETYVTPEWCAIYDGNLYVGSRDGDSAPSWQRIYGSRGDFTELITVFRLDENVKFGIWTRPVCAISSPSGVTGAYVSYKGFTFTSYSGEYGSSLLFYCFSTEESSNITLVSDERTRTVPLYFLDEAKLRGEIALPPMVEDVVLVDGRLSLFSSAVSDSGKVGELLGLDSFYTLPFDAKYFEEAEPAEN